MILLFNQPSCLERTNVVEPDTKRSLMVWDLTYAMGLKSHFLVSKMVFALPFFLVRRKRGRIFEEHMISFFSGKIPPPAANICGLFFQFRFREKNVLIPPFERPTQTMSNFPIFAAAEGLHRMRSFKQTHCHSLVLWILSTKLKSTGRKYAGLWW